MPPCQSFKFHLLDFDGIDERTTGAGSVSSPMLPENGNGASMTELNTMFKIYRLQYSENFGMRSLPCQYRAQATFVVVPSPQFVLCNLLAARLAALLNEAHYLASWLTRHVAN